MRMTLDFFYVPLSLTCSSNRLSNSKYRSGRIFFILLWSYKLRPALRFLSPPFIDLLKPKPFVIQENSLNYLPLLTFHQKWFFLNKNQCKANWLIELRAVPHAKLPVETFKEVNRPNFSFSRFKGGRMVVKFFWRATQLVDTHFSLQLMKSCWITGGPVDNEHEPYEPFGRPFETCAQVEPTQHQGTGTPNPFFQ